MAGRRGLPPLPQEELLNVDFLLPTGMLITLSCHKMSTLSDIKSAVWQEARNLPLFDNMLKDHGFYSFLGECVLLLLLLFVLVVTYSLKESHRMVIKKNFSMRTTR